MISIKNARESCLSAGLFSLEAKQMPYRKVGCIEQVWYILRWKLKEVFPMPRFPDHPCAHPGCPALVRRGKKYCDAHAKQHPEEIRSAAKRGYGNEWRKARKKYLEAHPLCEECLKLDRYVKATDVDHIIPHRGDPILFWDRNNWQALCHRCHSRKTGREDHYQEYKY